MGTVPIEHLTTTWTYNLSFDYGDDPTVQAPIPLSSFPDETLTPSVTLLVNLFGQVRGRVVALVSPLVSCRCCCCCCLIVGKVVGCSDIFVDVAIDVALLVGVGVEGDAAKTQPCASVSKRAISTAPRSTPAT